VDNIFEQLAEKYIDRSVAFSPVSATGLGDHRFDDQLDEISEAARAKQLQFNRDIRDALDQIDVEKLSRANQVDYQLLRHELDADHWHTTVLQEWAWNPLVYTQRAGSAIYSLVARDFAPLAERLRCVAKRLEQFPRFHQQVRETLDVGRVPAIHAETAVSQTKGILSIFEQMIRPQVDSLPDDQKGQLAAALTAAEQAINEQHRWLETEVLPNAKGGFRIGAELYDQKLAFALHSPLSRAEIRTAAERQLSKLHTEMYEIAKRLYREEYPLTDFPEPPADAFRRAIIRFGLEKAYALTPDADAIVATAEQSLAAATDFVRDNELVTIPPDPVNIITMPEFQRGVSLAYCDPPGPLETGQQTFYAVSPIPESWNEQQIRSHLREYNLRSLDILTIHEAMPGHFLQLAHSNRCPSRLRRFLHSGVFIEGWAVYTEKMMCESGYLDHDPILKLVSLKWTLRGVVNAILDQAVHVDGISRDDAMRLMVEDAFQEEREAAAKSVRAQLTSAQLPTYFVGNAQTTSPAATG